MTLPNDPQHPNVQMLQPLEQEVPVTPPFQTFLKAIETIDDLGDPETWASDWLDEPELERHLEEYISKMTNVTTTIAGVFGEIAKAKVATTA